MYKTLKSITLVELLVSMVIVSMMVLSFYSLDNFSRRQVISADRRSKVQNSLAYALEHMSKYVQQATGEIYSPGIAFYPPKNPRGFKVMVEGRWIRYELPSNSNTLKVDCSSGCPADFSENLSTKVLSGFVNGVLPAVLSLNPPGFYAKIEDEGSSIRIGLVGRYDPTLNDNRLTNPQVTMETKIICNACSAS